MNCKLLIAVVAALVPLTLGCPYGVGVGPVIQNAPWLGQLNGYGYDVNAQAQANAQAEAQAIAAQQQQLQSYLGGPQGMPYWGGLPVAAPALPVISGGSALPIGSTLPIGPALPVGPAVSVLPAANIPAASVNPYAAQEDIYQSLAESNLATQIRNNQVNVVAPNLSNDAVLQSVHVPIDGRYQNRVYASQPLPPMIVSQPGSPEVSVNSGPAAIVSAAPVIYRQPPNVVYQNEVINKHPLPLSLNPVYVKVYKPGKRVIATRPNCGC